MDGLADGMVDRREGNGSADVMVGLIARWVGGLDCWVEVTAGRLVEVG